MPDLLPTVLSPMPASRADGTFPDATSYMKYNDQGDSDGPHSSPMRFWSGWSHRSFALPGRSGTARAIQERRNLYSCYGEPPTAAPPMPDDDCAAPIRRPSDAARGAHSIQTGRMTPSYLSQPSFSDPSTKSGVPSEKGGDSGSGRRLAEEDNASGPQYHHQQAIRNTIPCHRSYSLEHSFVSPLCQASSSRSHQASVALAGKTRSRSTSAQPKTITPQPSFSVRKLWRRDTRRRISASHFPAPFASADPPSDDRRSDATTDCSGQQQQQPGQRFCAAESVLYIEVYEPELTRHARVFSETQNPPRSLTLGGAAPAKGTRHRIRTRFSARLDPKYNGFVQQRRAGLFFLCSAQLDDDILHHAALADGHLVSEDEVQ